MKHLETAPILASHLNQVTKNYTYVIHQFAPEDIHAFRVEIKKLRAFQRLAGGHHQQHLPKRLQQFYHFTGIIRNLQLQQQRIDEACRDQDQLPAAYLKELSASIAPIS